MKVYSTINRRERKKLDTRQKIVKLAAYLFRKNGYEATTMEQIASEVDIAKGTLYNYFPVKESIVCEYWNNNTAGFKPRAIELINQLPDTKSRLLKTLTRTVDHFSSNKDMFRIYLRYRLKTLHNSSNRVNNGLEDILTIIIKTGQSSGDIRRDVGADVLVKYIEIMFLMGSLSRLEGNGPASPETDVFRIVDIFLEGASSGALGARKSSLEKKTKAKSGDLLQLPL
jgi:AcrR family transcriptional regulator